MNCFAACFSNAFFACFSLVALTCTLSTAAHAQRIAAASDLQPVLDTLVKSYNAQHAAFASVTYASTGKLAMQIESGAPFDVFFSADEKWLARLSEKKMELTRSRIGFGRLALVAQLGHPVCAHGLGAMLNTTDKIAIANPDHAPYGARAREVLAHAGVWTPLSQARRIAAADAVATAAQWVRSGLAPVGIIGWTHASQFEKTAFCVTKIPTAQHSGLVQEVALVKAPGKAFYDWVRAPEQLRRFTQAGLDRD